jgi:hypothetical protein
LVFVHEHVIKPLADWEHRPAMQRYLVMPGKRVQFDHETLHALNVLARDRMMDFQELADEAFGDLLKKHGRSTDLKAVLREKCEKGRSRTTLTGLTRQFSPKRVGSPLSTIGEGGLRQRA